MLASDAVLATVRSGKYDLMSGKGVLHCAAWEGHLEMLEMLVQAGAPIDANDGHGLTALQVEPGSSDWDVASRSGSCLKTVLIFFL